MAKIFISAPFPTTDKVWDLFNPDGHELRFGGATPESDLEYITSWHPDMIIVENIEWNSWLGLQVKGLPSTPCPVILLSPLMIFSLDRFETTEPEAATNWDPQELRSLVISSFLTNG